MNSIKIATIKYEPEELWRSQVTPILKSVHLKLNTNQNMQQLLLNAITILRAPAVCWYYSILTMYYFIKK